MAKVDFVEEAVVEGREDVAQRFGVSERTVYRWEKAGMPVRSDQRYDLGQIIRWKEQKKGKREDKPERDPQKEDLARHARIKADLAELKFRKEQGELVGLAEVETLFAGRALIFRQGALGFTRSLPPQLINCQTEREMEAVLIKGVRELLENVLRSLPEKFRIVDELPDTQDIVSG